MSDSSNKVITRFPPSPTGFLHIGGVRTALFNYLYTAHADGSFYLRFEDTDKERSKKEYEIEILESLIWLNIPFASKDFPRQSERTDVYKNYLHKLIDAGVAYEAEETKDDSTKKVIRFKNPNVSITFTDLVRDEVTFDTTDLGDFVIARSIDEPLYHLAVVIDDHEMGITHVIRGEEHISNTPRQILILEALGFKRPIYAHIPLIVDDHRQKLSKRKHGASVWAKTYKEEGYLPEAIINYLALLGWNPGNDQEIFTREELVTLFDITRVQKSSAVFDVKKLRWMNKEYMKKLPREELKSVIASKLENILQGKEIPEAVYNLIIERIDVYSDIDKMIEEEELSYIFETPSLEKEKIAWKDSSIDEAKEHLGKVKDLIQGLGDTTLDTVKSVLMPYAEEKGKGNVLWPLRYSLSGKEKSPDPFTLISILGKEGSISRIDEAMNILS